MTEGGTGCIYNNKLGVIVNLGVIGMTKAEAASLVKMMQAVTNDGTQLESGTCIACTSRQGFQFLAAVLMGAPKETLDGGLLYERYLPEHMFSAENALLEDRRGSGDVEEYSIKRLLFF